MLRATKSRDFGSLWRRVKRTLTSNFLGRTTTGGPRPYPTSSDADVDKRSSAHKHR